MGDHPEIYATYSDTIEEQARLGRNEPAPLKPKGQVVHYISHHCVITSQMTTKLKTAFDASAKSGRYMPGLNECSFWGPIVL